MNLLPLLPLLLNPPAIQVPNAVRNFIMVYGRPSEGIKQRQSEVIRASYRSAVSLREQRKARITVANKSEQTAVSTAPAAITVQLDNGNEEIHTYLADVDLPVLNEDGKPVNAPVPIEYVIKNFGGPKPDFVGGATTPRTKPLSSGRLVLSNVELPALVEVRLSPETEADGWALDGDVQYVAVLLPDKPHGEVLSTHSGKRLVTKQLANGDRAKVDIESTTIVEKLKVQTRGPLRLRREVADFIVPKPAILHNDPWAELAIFISGGDGEKSILSQSEDASSWKLKVRRDAIREGSSWFVVQASTRNGQFGGEVSLGKVDYYGDNRLASPVMTLESIPYGSVTLLGRAITADCPISPIMWLQGDSGTQHGAPPKVITGADACSVLHLAPDPKNITEPAPKDKEKARFGRWLNFPEQGIGLRCRYELDSKLRPTGDKAVLPNKNSHGLLEAVRVFSPEAGSIGPLHVGASRSEIEAAYGSFDTKFDLSVIGLTPANQAALIYGQASVEAPDDTLLRDGIRIKWDGDRVKWFEISRPIQLLYNGTRAFQPSLPKTIFVEDLRTDSLDAAATVSGQLRDWAEMASGFVAAKSAEEANLLIMGELTTDEYRWQVTHSFEEYVQEEDKDGNIQSKWVTHDESFMCPALTVRANVDITIRSNDANSELSHFSWEGSNSSANNHQAGKRCDYPIGISLLRELLRFKGKTAESLRRQITNACAEESGVTGAVVAINYETGQMLINLGRDHGIRKKTEQEGTEFNVYMLFEVDPETGASVNPNIDSQRLMGKSFDEWVEVEEVGDDWCVAVPKKKERSLGGLSTRTAFGQIPRLIDPGSGLLRVQVKPKGTAKKR